jgi:hypothetical protein
MLAIDERSAPVGLHLQDTYFDGSLELLRELAVTIDLDTALPRLYAERERGGGVRYRHGLRNLVRSRSLDANASSRYAARGFRGRLK